MGKAERDKFGSITLTCSPRTDKTHFLEEKCVFNPNEDMWELPCPEEPEDFGPLPLFISLTFAMLIVETMSDISFPLNITYDLVLDFCVACYFSSRNYWVPGGT